MNYSDLNVMIKKVKLKNSLRERHVSKVGECIKIKLN